MSLVIAVVVVFGFSQTVGRRLFHPTIAPPPIIYPHAAVFSTWVVFFIVQTSLVRMRKVNVHRALGWLGVALGATIPVLGIFTAATMDHFRMTRFHDATAAPFLSVQICDLSSFTIPFVLAVYWRRRPEFHRRLMLVASCALTAAAFGRFPWDTFAYNWFYAGVDSLVILGVVSDLILTRSVHPVYRYALPAMIVAQSTAISLANWPPAWWNRLTTSFLS